MQALELAARHVALHARGAGVDDVADARHRQRGFGDVRRQHDAPLRAGLEHAVLLGGGQARIQRQYFRRAVFAARQRQVRIADLAFAGQEDEHVAAAVFVRDLVDGGDDAFGGGRIIAVLRRSPAHFDRETAALDVDYRRVVEMFRERGRVDRRGGDDQFQILAPRQQSLEITQQEVDVEAAFVRLVEDDRVVAVEPGIRLRFGEQDAVGHELDQRAFAGGLGETHLETHDAAEFGAELRGDATRHAARGHAAWLRAADQAGDAASGGQAQFG